MCRWWVSYENQSPGSQSMPIRLINQKIRFVDRSLLRPPPAVPGHRRIIVPARPEDRAKLKPATTCRQTRPSSNRFRSVFTLLLNPRHRHSPAPSLPVRPPAAALRPGRRSIAQRRLAGLQLDRQIARRHHAVSRRSRGRRPFEAGRHRHVPFRNGHRG
jgi:hypothetical protein